MPPALHPRSSHTLTLFTSTLALSFLVVGLPHLVPCPVKPQTYADGPDGAPRRRRRRKVEGADAIEAALEREENEELGMYDLVREGEGRRRECPVPKPGGLVGEILGLRKVERAERPVVRVERLDARSRRIVGEEGEGKG
jgi:cytochrome c oxidase assembly factor 2